MAAGIAGADSTEVVVGVIRRPHGVRGDLTVELRTDEPARRFVAGARLRCEDTDRELTVTSAREASGRWLVHFAEVSDRSSAESLRNTLLVVDVPTDARPEEPEEFYDRQLVDLSVRDATGSEIGRVREVLHLPGQDLLEIGTAGGPRLVPFVSALVPQIDLDAGYLQLADVPGLLDDTDEA